uniref:Uncharacterized protein n=1 Tax=Oryza punctata TaxID=4537 RepID=A0A0E0MHD5_ORYPU
MEDKEEDDFLSSGRGSSEKLSRRCGLASANAGARVPAIPREFFRWMCLEREEFGRGARVLVSSAAMEREGWACQGLCFLSRKSNGRGDLVGARRFGQNGFVYL